MSEPEIIAAMLGVINVVLIVRRSIWNYPFGIAMVILYGFVFYTARLYSDAALQLYFLLVQIYGWWNWIHARNPDGEIRIELLTPMTRTGWAAIALIAIIAEGWALSRYTNDAAPWMDSTTTILSVVAQYFLSMRKIENWILWIVADVIQIGLYYWKGLYPTTVLYLVFLGLATIGYWSWLNEYRRQRAA